MRRAKNKRRKYELFINSVLQRRRTRVEQMLINKIKLFRLFQMNILTFRYNVEPHAESTNGTRFSGGVSEATKKTIEQLRKFESI